MKTEYEVKFLDIDLEKTIENIKSLWGKLEKKKTLMRRVVFETPVNKKWSYIRVRDEWDKITTTYKEENLSKLDINSVKELETTVWSFEEMKAIYKKLGLKDKSYQENYREVWEINQEIELMIDTWPWLKTYIEIEWENEEIVRIYSKKLWFDYKSWVFGSVFQIYKKKLWLWYEYINSLKEITFENPPKA